jgi:hypothetical protein
MWLQGWLAAQNTKFCVPFVLSVTGCMQGKLFHEIKLLKFALDHEEIYYSNFPTGLSLLFPPFLSGVGGTAVAFQQHGEQNSWYRGGAFCLPVDE